MEYICNKCKAKRKIIEGKNFLTYQCPICVLSQKLDDDIEAILINIAGSFYGSLIFKTSDETNQLLDTLRFSPGMSRKHIIGHRFEQENMWIVNSYFLLASYLEKTFYEIASVYNKDKNNFVVQEINFCKYEAITFGKKDNFFEINRLTFPRFMRVANFVRHAANVLKHQGVLVGERSSKILINEYHLRKNVEFIYHRGNAIFNVVPKVRIGNVYKIAGMIDVFLKDFCSIAFASNGIKRVKLDMKKLTLQLDVEPREEIFDLLEKNLIEEGICESITRLSEMQ